MDLTERIKDFTRAQGSIEITTETPCAGLKRGPKYDTTKTLYSTRKKNAAVEREIRGEMESSLGKNGGTDVSRGYLVQGFLRNVRCMWFDGFTEWFQRRQVILGIYGSVVYP